MNHVELFAGIGGFRRAMDLISIDSKIKIKTVAFSEIDEKAVLSYCANFQTENEIAIGDIVPFVKNEENINKLPDFDIISGGFPCQTFSMMGKQLGFAEDRGQMFFRIMDILQKRHPKFVLLENVKNFEISEANKMLIDILIQKKFSFIQFLLSPVQFNIPNSRLRFYLIASKIKQFDIKEYSSNPNNIIKDANIIFKDKILPEKDIQTFLNFENDDDYIKNKGYYLTKDILDKKSCLSMDIALLGNKSTNCFTKGYTKLFKGTGSILLLNDKLYKSNLNPISLLGAIRYFTPNEILKFLCFSENFSFPDNLSEKTKYRLLGNSINVKVVNILMNYLLN